MAGVGDGEVPHRNLGLRVEDLDQTRVKPTSKRLARVSKGGLSDRVVSWAEKGEGGNFEDGGI